MEVSRIEEIYAKISKYQINLQSDPASLGPVYLFDIIATCRNYLNEVGQILLEVHREKHKGSRLLNAKKTLHSAESDNILATDDVVKKLPSIDDRKAAINVKLRDLVREIADLETEQHNLEQVDKAVRLVHRELKDTMGEIKLQRNLIRDEIDSGSFYGDEREKGKPVIQPKSDDNEMAEIDRLVREMNDGKPPVGETRAMREVMRELEENPPIREPAESKKPTSEEEDIDRFLQDVDEVR